MSSADGTSDAHRSIVRGMLAVAAFALLGKVAGAAKEIAVAWRYGVSAEVDAYLFVLNLVSWPVAVWFSGLAVILIPMEARIREESRERLTHFRAELLGVTLLLGIALSLGARFGLPALLTSGWLGLPARTASLAIQLVPGLAWLVLLGLLVGLYSTWMMSTGRHVNTLLEGVPALGILVAVLLAGGIEALLWGTLAGTVAQLAFVGAPVSARGFRDVPAFGFSSPEWTPFWQGFGVMMLSQAIMSLTSLIDQFFAAKLGEGSISALGYSGRILALMLGLAATAITRATLPVFSRARAAGSDLRQLAVRWSGLTWVGGLFVGVIGWALAPWGVRLLFERGTFTSADTAQVAELLRFGLPQLAFFFSSLVLVSLHSSLGRYKVLLMSSIVGLAVKAVASYVLLARLGVSGLMLAQAVVYAVNNLLLMKAIPRRSSSVTAA